MGKLFFRIGFKEGLVHLMLVWPVAWQYVLLRMWDECCTMSTGMFYAARALFCLLLAAAIIALSKRDGFQITKLTYAGAAAFCILPLLPTLGFPSIANEVIIAVLGSTSLAWFYLCCGMHYKKLMYGQACIYVLVSLIMGYLLRMVLTILPNEVVFYVAAFIPIAMQYAYVLSSRMDSLVMDGDPPYPPDKKFISAIAFELVIFGVLAGFFRVVLEAGYFTTQSMLITEASHVVISTLLLVWVATRKHGVRIMQLFQAALLGCLFAFVVLSFGESWEAASVYASSFPQIVVFALFWLLLVDLEACKTRYPYAVFCVGWAVYLVSIAAGQYMGEAVGQHDAVSQNILISLSAFLVASVVFVFSNYASRDRLYFKVEEGEQLYDPDFMEKRCAVLAEEYGLTSRELEIVTLISKGRTKSYIADYLVISENTVKGHARNAYSKLEVHSRQELLNLVGLS